MTKLEVGLKIIAEICVMAIFPLVIFMMGFGTWMYGIDNEVYAICMVSALTVSFILYNFYPEEALRKHIERWKQEYKDAK